MPIKRCVWAGYHPSHLPTPHHIHPHPLLFKPSPAHYTSSYLNLPLSYYLLYHLHHGMAEAAAMWDEPPSLLDTSELSSELSSFTLPPHSPHTSSPTNSDSEAELSFPSSPPPPSLPHLTERQQLSYLLRITQSSPPKPSHASDRRRAPKPSLMSHDKKRRPPTSPLPSSSYAVHRLPSQAAPSPLSLPLSFPSWAPIRQRRFVALPTHPNVYYYHHPPPGVKERQGSFTALEAQWFRHLLRSHPVGGAKEWGLFSLNLPGRTGRRCEEEWKAMVARGWREGRKEEEFDYAAWYEAVKRSPQEVWGEPDGDEGSQKTTASEGGGQPLTKVEVSTAAAVEVGAKPSVAVMGRKRVHAVEEAQETQPPSGEKKAKVEAPPLRPQLREHTEKPSKPAAAAVPEVVAPVVVSRPAVMDDSERPPLPPVDKPLSANAAPAKGPPLPLSVASPTTRAPLLPVETVSSFGDSRPLPVEKTGPPPPAPAARTTRRTPLRVLSVNVPASASSQVSSNPWWKPTPPVFRSAAAASPALPALSALPPVVWPLPSLGSMGRVEVEVLRCRVRLELRLRRLQSVMEAERRRAEGVETAMSRVMPSLREEYYGVERGTWTGEGEGEGKGSRQRGARDFVALAADLRKQFDVDVATLQAMATTAG